MLNAKIGKIRECGTGIVVFLLLLTGFLAVTDGFPLTWDEGETFKRADKISQWFRLLTKVPTGDATSVALAGPTNALTAPVIRQYWFHTTRIEGHPAGYSLLSAAGKGVCQGLNFDFLSEKVQYRFGPIFLFSLALSVCFLRLKKSFGTATALFSLLAILSLPRVFAHAQIAACDSPLMAAWLLVWATFESGLKSGKQAVLWGIALGLGLTMKFTGWLIPVPFLCFALYTFITRKRVRGLIRLFLTGIPIALLVFYLLNPNIWHHPLEGLERFFYLNTHRSALNIRTLFLGEIYGLDRSLPWYNTVVWTVFTVPLGLLLTGLWLLSAETGTLFRRFCSFRQTRKEPVIAESLPQEGVLLPGKDMSEEKLPSSLQILLLLLNFLTLIIVRALPGVPVHDGVRLFVAAFPFWGILAGIGAARLWTGNCEPVSRLSPESSADSVWGVFRSYGSKGLVLGVFLFSGFNLFWYAPQWLSYYSFPIGGLKGAATAGMEPTYYCDALDDEVLLWLKNHRCIHSSFPDGEGKNLFFLFSPSVLRLNMEWDKLGPSRVTMLGEFDPDGYQWYIFQNRPGIELAEKANEIRKNPPVYNKYIRKGGYGPWNLGETPILSIYAVEE